MPRRPSPARRWITALTWPAGILLTCWDYMWRITPLHRREIIEQAPDEHLPPGFPDGVSREAVMGAEQGRGPLFHRRYAARVRDADLNAGALLTELARNLNQAAPTTFARFQKVYGTKERLAPGDEYVVRMPGPWDGPVRVIARGEDSFRLATLAGHLEAGQIEFRFRQQGDELLVEIESWARSANRLSHLLYHRLRMAKEVQFHMWVSFLERAAKLAGGRLDDGVTIETTRVETGFS